MNPKPEIKKLPFDSLTLAAVAHELQPYVGAKAQKFIQPDEHTIMLGLYSSEHGEAHLLISVDPLFHRMHLSTKRFPAQQSPPLLQTLLKARLNQARLKSIKQIGLDRIVELTFDQFEDEYRLIVELMGKHSNAIFVGPGKKIEGALKHIGPNRSPRPIVPGRQYEPPPTAGRPSLFKAKEGDDLKDFEGVSPFLMKLITNGGVSLEDVKQRLKSSRFEPVLVPGHGAYPISVAALGLTEHHRESISIALEQHYNLAVPAHQSEQLRQSLTNQLQRVILARDVAISELEQAKDAAARAGRMQLMGELILAYGSTLDPEQKELQAEDYEGNLLTIKLDPEKTYLENAKAYFEKAKRAKAGVGMVNDQLARLSTDRAQIDAILMKVETAETLHELEALRDQAKQKRYLHSQPAPSAKKEDQPYEGHRIRELLGPGGVRVLFGENATSNDYLTLRIAKPDDFWLHVRGGVSAHVVIPTQKHPEKIGREALMFAAKVAVQHSPAKHSGFVPVDYTLKKYVRKPRGAQPGAALYTHEKTLHVER